MALLHSEPLELGSLAPNFSLKSVDGRIYSLSDFKSAEVLIVLFICGHCPYVQAIEERLASLRKYYAQKPVQMLGICSNDPTDYPEDLPENLRKRAEAHGYGFPYLIDETQEVAKAYKAVCTPDLYVYDQNRRLAYHGRLDDSWKDATLVKNEELKRAVDTLLAGKRPEEEQHPSMGCSIKWKKATSPSL